MLPVFPALVLPIVIRTFTLYVFCGSVTAFYHSDSQADRFLQYVFDRPIFLSGLATGGASKQPQSASRNFSSNFVSALWHPFSTSCNFFLSLLLGLSRSVSRVTWFLHCSIARLTPCDPGRIFSSTLRSLFRRSVRVDTSPLSMGRFRLPLFPFCLAPVLVLSSSGLVREGVLYGGLSSFSCPHFAFGFRFTPMGWHTPFCPSTLFSELSTAPLVLPFLVGRPPCLWLGGHGYLFIMFVWHSLSSNLFWEDLFG